MFADIQLNKTARDGYGHRAMTWRFELPLTGATGSAEQLFLRDFEFPTINEAWKGSHNLSACNVPRFSVITH